MKAVIQPIRLLLYNQLICAIFISIAAFLMSELGTRESYRNMGIAIPIVSAFASAIGILMSKIHFRNLPIILIAAAVFQFTILASYAFFTGERLGQALDLGDGITLYSAIFTGVHLFILCAIYALFLLSSD